MRMIPIGAEGSFTLEVPERLASQFKDAMLPDVLATPVLVMVIENAALAALEPYLEPGETAVGTYVAVRHLVPTLVGMRVIGEASVTRVEGRQIQFRVSAADEGGQIGAGSHERMVVDAARTVRDEATGGEGCEGSPSITRPRARYVPNRRRSTCFTVHVPPSCTGRGPEPIAETQADIVKRELRAERIVPGRVARVRCFSVPCIDAKPRS
jgi:fluoroacetyl-CoA thioesterase